MSSYSRSRPRRKAVAEETLAILDRGSYEHPEFGFVPVGPSLREAKSGSKLIRPADLESYVGAAMTLASKVESHKTGFTVTNASVVEVAKSLTTKDRSNPLVLNFASAKNPGGGFLNGSQAQEESIARASGLYACQLECRGYYDANRECGHCLYTDHLIYSPLVPFIRDERDNLLPAPFLASILTAPAPNVSGINQNRRSDLSAVIPTLARRMDFVLAAAAVHGHRTLILGAWGCGVFGNDPVMVATLFHERLHSGGQYSRLFDLAAFAVLDSSGNQGVIGPFLERFGSLERVSRH